MSCDGFPTASSTKNFKENTDFVKEFVESFADTATTPDGLTKKTVTGLETIINDAVASVVPKSFIGTWQQGITTFNSLNEYAEFNDTPYVAKTGVTLPYVAQTSSPLTSPDSDNVQPYTQQPDTVENVEDLTIELGESSYYKTVFVEDVSRGGAFEYDTARKLENDGGTVFNGWVRQYFSPYVNIKWFGASGDGITDDTNHFLLAFATGNSVYAPEGVYVVSEVVNIGVVSELYGAVAAKLVGDGVGKTIFRSSATTGEVFRVSNFSAYCAHFTVSSTDDRISNGDSTCFGIRHEGNDFSTGHRFAKFGKYFDMSITDQPSHGMAIVGNAIGTELDKVAIYGNKGHGLIADSGETTGRVNASRCGGVTLNDCEITYNTGQAVVAGYNSVDVNVTNSVYRFIMNNCDMFGNALTADKRITQSQALIIGENISLRDNAFGGWSGDPRTLVTKGISVAGKSIDIHNTRFIDVDTNAIEILEFENIPSRSIDVEQIQHTGTVGNMLNPAVLSSQGVEGVTVKSYDSGNVTTLHSRSTTKNSTVIDENGRTNTAPSYSPAFNSSFGTFTIPDDNVYEIDFGANASGIFILGSNSQSRGFAMIHFRAGSFPHCSLLASSGNTFSGNAGADVVATTGVLTGTTGTDGSLTISANTDNKLYIENRTGDNGVYTRAFIAASFSGEPPSIKP